MLAFAPHRLTESIEAMYDAQPADDPNGVRVQAGDAVAECNRKIARYREAWDAGADPVVVAGWIVEVQARRGASWGRSTASEAFSPVPSLRTRPRSTSSSVCGSPISRGRGSFELKHP